MGPCFGLVRRGDLFLQELTFKFYVRMVQCAPDNLKNSV